MTIDSEAKNVEPATEEKPRTLEGVEDAVLELEGVVSKAIGSALDVGVTPGQIIGAIEWQKNLFIKFSQQHLFVAANEAAKES